MQVATGSFDRRRVAGWLGATGASAVRGAERLLHRLARPASIAMAPVLLRQATALQASLVPLPEPTGSRVGRIDRDPVGGPEAEPLRLLAVGDSTATGVGADRLEDALPVQTATRLAELLLRPVRWRIEAQEGRIAELVLAHHMRQLEGGTWDVVMVQVGANDALQLIARRRFRRAVRGLVATLEQHRAPHGIITLAGVPQIDTFAWLPQPVRSLLGGHARSLDAELVAIARELPHVIHLPTPAILEPELHASDGFHPSSAGYRAWSHLIAPRIVAALGDAAP